MGGVSNSRSLIFSLIPLVVLRKELDRSDR